MMNQNAGPCQPRANSVYDNRQPRQDDYCRSSRTAEKQKTDRTNSHAINPQQRYASPNSPAQQQDTVRLCHPRQRIQLTGILRVQYPVGYLSILQDSKILKASGLRHQQQQYGNCCMQKGTASCDAHAIASAIRAERCANRIHTQKPDLSKLNKALFFLRLW